MTWKTKDLEKAQAEKKARIKAIREKLANLTPEQRNEIASKGIVQTVEGRQLSLHNTILLQIQANGKASVVGGYQQWRQAGKQVRKGEHGYTIWFPAKKKEDDEPDNKPRFFTGTVFDISQVADITEGDKPTTIMTPPAPEPTPRPTITQAEISRAQDEIMKGFEII